MIKLSRLNGQIIAINPDLITWIEVTPDTTLSFLGGDKVMVREGLEEVIERVVAFRREVGSHAYPPSKAAIESIALHRTSHSQPPQHRGSHSQPPPSQRK